jgi:hypothetical protein
MFLPPNKLTTWRSTTLKMIDREYPGLSESNVNGVRVSRFVACADASPQIKDFHISRDRSGVHMSGLFKDQDFSAGFIDTGNDLQVISASIGGAEAANALSAAGLFDNVSAAITGHCPQSN